MASNENFSKRDAWLREEARLQREIQELNDALDYQTKQATESSKKFKKYKDEIMGKGYLSGDEDRELQTRARNFQSYQKRLDTSMRNLRKQLEQKLQEKDNAVEAYQLIQEDLATHAKKAAEYHEKVQKKTAQLATRLKQQQEKARQQEEKEFEATVKELETTAVNNFNKRQKVIDGLAKRFGSTKVAQAFAQSPQMLIGPDGQMTSKGERKAEQLEMQSKFIRRLVQAFATLPIFDKAGRAIQQLGLMTMMSGVARFRQGGIKNQLQGIGTVGLGLAEYLAPALASAFGTVMTTVVAKKIEEAVMLGSLKGGMGMGTSMKLAWAKIAMMNARTGGGLVKGGAAISLAGLGIAGASSLFGDRRTALAQGKTGKANALGILGGGVALAGIGAAIAAVIAGVFAPVTVTIAAIGGVLFLIGKNIDKIVGWFTTAKDWLSKQFDKINPFNKGDKSNPSYTGMPVGTEEVVQAVSGKKVDPKAVHTFSTDRFNIYQYGSSRGERGGATVMGSKYTRAQLEQMGREGKGGLETLHGLRLADTFYNDARVARAGSSAILQAVQAKTGIPLTITSAMASKTSGHALGKLGHEGGQKFDFSASGMNAQQALQYAQTLYATGYFSHAEAEYDKKTGQWHIDARIADQAYKAVEDIQKGKQQEKQVQLQKTSPRVKEAPGTAKVADVINGSLGLRNSLYGPAIGI